jgi:hypothetical protein
LADFAADRTSSVRGLLWASIEHYSSREKLVTWLGGGVSYAAEQVLLEVELDIRVLLDYFKDLYV